MSNQTDTEERADLAKWRQRRQCESAARKPRNKSKYRRVTKHKNKRYDNE